MKKLIMILTLALVLGGGALGLMSSASQAQVYVPAQTVIVPQVGPNTPWVFYNGDWFRNGLLYYFFGNKIGWAPYYAYAPTYIARPTYWYAPRWNAWYQAHPTHWKNFQQRYPYWRGHHLGQHYDQAFYNRYHHGQGNGWQKGFHGAAYPPGSPANRNPHPGNVGHSHGPQAPGQPGRFQPDQPAHGQKGPERKVPQQRKPGEEPGVVR
jgi:hypothetical protein